MYTLKTALSIIASFFLACFPVCVCLYLLLLMQWRIKKHNKTKIESNDSTRIRNAACMKYSVAEEMQLKKMKNPPKSLEIAIK